MKPGPKPIYQERIRSLADGTRTVQQVANEAGCSAATVRFYAREMNLPLRPAREEGTHYPIRDALEAYADGLNDGGKVAREALLILCRESRP